MRQILDRLLKRMIQSGGLTVVWPNGETSLYGSDAQPAGFGVATIKLTDDKTVRSIVLNPGLAVGEAYMGETLIPQDCSIYQVLDVLLTNLKMAGMSALPTMQGRVILGTMVRRLRQINSAVRSRRNVAHHYDLNGRLYSLFLDRDRQYSCAYFPRGDETLEEAQVAKKRHIAAKLKLDRPDLHGAGHRLRLGRHGADPGARLRRAGHRHHPLHRATGRGARPRRGRGPVRPREVRTAGLPRGAARASTASSRSACSSMSASTTTAPSSTW